VYFIFSCRAFLKTILASRNPKAIGSTFGFAPTAQADTQAKSKRAVF